MGAQVEVRDPHYGSFASFTVQGKPVPKARARVTKQGFAFTPAHTKKYEMLIRYAAQGALAGRPPATGPLLVRVLVCLPIPASLSKKRSAMALAGKIKPTKRPDLDNYIKAVLDGCDVLWRDDSQVVAILARKAYSDRPRLTVGVDVIADCEAA